jgi:hypothetical protein
MPLTDNILTLLPDILIFITIFVKGLLKRWKLGSWEIGKLG